MIAAGVGWFSGDGGVDQVGGYGAGGRFGAGVAVRPGADPARSKSTTSLLGG
jgi:hypothetical protein